MGTVHPGVAVCRRASAQVKDSGREQTSFSRVMIRWSTKNLSFVSNKSQARITGSRTIALSALSLLAPPMARAQAKSTSEAREVPRESENIKGCSRVRSGVLCSPEPGAVRRPRFGKAEKRRRSGGAGVRRHEGGRRTLLRPSEVWSSMLSTGPGRRSVQAPMADRSTNAFPPLLATRRRNGAWKKGRV